MRSRGSSSPAAARCPPWRVRCSEHASSAAIRSKPGMLRADPRAVSPSIASSTTGFQWRVGQPRGGDPDDAGVPALPRQHQRRRLGLLERQRGARLLGSVGDLALGRAPLGVGLVELGGDRLGAGGIVGQHQLHSRVGPVQAPGRVDPRRQPEPQGVLGDPLGLHLRGRHQRAQPGRGGPCGARPAPGGPADGSRRSGGPCRRRSPAPPGRAPRARRRPGRRPAAAPARACGRHPRRRAR